MASPHTPEKTFIEVWNKNNGDSVKVAKELGISYNSAWVRGNRLLKKYGVIKPTRASKVTFELRYEDMK